MYGTVPGIPALPKIQRTSGCREVKRLAPKILTSLNPVMDNTAANALDGVCGTIITLWDFPGGAVVENPPASAGDTGSIPGPGRSHVPQSN